MELLVIEVVTLNLDIGKWNPILEMAEKAISMLPLVQTQVLFWLMSKKNPSTVASNSFHDRNTCNEVSEISELYN